MAKQTISLGTEPKGETGDTSRVAFLKCIANFDELYLRQQGALNKSIAGAAGVVSLTPEEVANGFIFLTGPITGNKDVTVPDGTPMMWTVVNGTTGGYTVKVRTVSGTGVLIPSGYGLIVFSNGVNVIDPAAGAQVSETGKVVFFAVNAPPSGYLECNGAAVPRNTYGALFSRIGTTWGAGDGSTTFNVPDLRGEFIRGWDHGKGTDSARGFATSQTDELKAHAHALSTQSTGGSAIRSANGGSLKNDASLLQYLGTDASTAYPIYIQAAGGVETRPRNIAMLPCIRH